jgi:hypothetical protein
MVDMPFKEVLVPFLMAVRDHPRLEDIYLHKIKIKGSDVIPHHGEKGWFNLIKSVCTEPSSIKRLVIDELLGDRFKMTDEEVEMKRKLINQLKECLLHI